MKKMVQRKVTDENPPKCHHGSYYLITIFISVEKPRGKKQQACFLQIAINAVAKLMPLIDGRDGLASQRQMRHDGHF